MFSVRSEDEGAGRPARSAVLRDDEPLAFGDAVDLWQRSEAFRAFFIRVLAGSPYEAFRWETPPVSRDTIGRPLEFVLIDAPGLAGPGDPAAFAEHFRAGGDAVVTFENLGRDALLVVPSPRGPAAAYGHLGAFVRAAPSEQVHALWRAVGRAVRTRLGDRPLWLSTAGGGVDWLHVRLDARPKYYAYAPFAREA